VRATYPDHLRYQLECAWNARDKAELCQGGGSGLGVQFRIGNQIPRRGGIGKGRYQGLGPFLKNLRIGRIAIPTFAHQGDAAILRHHQLQHSLLQIRPMIFGIAMGNGNGLLIALGDIGATEGKAGGVKMMKALRNAFLDTNG
jgi:hypothetical protein